MRRKNPARPILIAICFYAAAAVVGCLCYAGMKTRLFSPRRPASIAEASVSEAEEEDLTGASGERSDVDASPADSSDPTNERSDTDGVSDPAGDRLNADASDTSGAGSADTDSSLSGVSGSNSSDADSSDSSLSNISEPNSSDANSSDSSLSDISGSDEISWAFSVDGLPPESQLNVRPEPSEDSSVLYQIPAGTTGYVLEKGEEWSLVRCSDAPYITGYVSNQYLRFWEISFGESD